MGTKKRSSSEWLELLECQRGSGQTMKSWCHENNINLNTMADRACRLRKNGQFAEGNPKTREKPSEKTGWVEVTQEKLSLKVEPEPLKADIQVKIGGFTIIIPPVFEEAAFTRVCRALVAVC